MKQGPIMLQFTADTTEAKKGEGFVWSLSSQVVELGAEPRFYSTAQAFGNHATVPFTELLLSLQSLSWLKCR